MQASSSSSAEEESPFSSRNEIDEFIGLPRWQQSFHKNHPDRMKTEDVIRFDSILPDKKRCILSRQSPWQKRWSLVVMMLAVYNCLWLPIEIAFEPAAA